MMKNMMKNSNLKFKIGLLLPTLIMISAFTVILAASMMYTPMSLHNPPSNDPTKQIPDTVMYDYEFFYSAHAILSSINAVLLIVMLCIFISIYKKTKSEFSFGLIFFGIAFLIKDLIANPYITGALSYYAAGLGPFIVLPDLFEFAALSALLYLHIKY
jgi:hypothetical protein